MPMRILALQTPVGRMNSLKHTIVNAAGLWSSKRATSTRASGLLTMVLDFFTTWCYDVDRLVLAVQVVVIGFARVM